ncbi:MAG: competence protein CoiA family protein [Candidatus Odinarchaeota archaeon]
MEENKKIIHGFNFELGKIYNILDGLPSDSERYTWLCTICKKPLFYNKTLDCFLHKGNRNYCFEPENIEHKTMKVYWYIMFPRFNRVSSKKMEYRIGDQIADVYFELTDGMKIVIECQNSQISKRKLIERTKNYTHKDIYTLWIFNGYGTCVSDKKNPRNMEKVGVLGMEKRVYNLYGGRIYYMNVSGRNVIDSPYAIHFSPFFEYKKSDYNYLGYDKYYKDKCSGILGKIPSYKIICINVKGYKLARFTDKHVGSNCTEQIIKAIREVCQKYLVKGKACQEEIEIPISSIISKVKNRYGIHLPHLLLKNSSKIKNVSLEKVFDKNYNISEFIKVKISDYL